MSKGRTKRNRLLGLVNHWNTIADEWDAKDRRSGLGPSAESIEVRECAKDLREVIDEMYEVKAQAQERPAATYKLGSVLSVTVGRKRSAPPSYDTQD